MQRKALSDVDRMVLEFGATTVTPKPALSAAIGSQDWTMIPDHTNLHVPPSTSVAQAYYWTNIWQEGEREALRDYAAGDFVEFANADDAIRYLLSADE